MFDFTPFRTASSPTEIGLCHIQASCGATDKINHYRRSLPHVTRVPSPLGGANQELQLPVHLPCDVRVLRHQPQRHPATGRRARRARRGFLQNLRPLVFRPRPLPPIPRIPLHPGGWRRDGEAIGILRSWQCLQQQVRGLGQEGRRAENPAESARSLRISDDSVPRPHLGSLLKHRQPQLAWPELPDRKVRLRTSAYAPPPLLSTQNLLRGCELFRLIFRLSKASFLASPLSPAVPPPSLPNLLNLLSVSAGTVRSPCRCPPAGPLPKTSRVSGGGGGTWRGRGANRQLQRHPGKPRTRAVEPSQDGSRLIGRVTIRAE